MNERLAISGEKTGFANSAKSANNKKYGSTNKKPVAAPPLAQPQSFIQHQVSPADTIQGLSLRYGVTPELIKRCNNLFTNDSIHLKTCIKIPVLSPSLSSSQSEQCLSHPSNSANAPAPLIPSAFPPSSSFSSSSGGGPYPPPHLPHPPPSSSSHPLEVDLLSPSVPPPSVSSTLPRPQASPSLMGAGVPPISSFDAIIPGLSLPPPKRNSPIARLPTSSSIPESLNSFQALPRNPDGSFVPREDDDGAGEDKSVSSILNKIDSMLLKSKEDVKQYEQRKSDYVSNDDDENFSYQSGSAFHYYP